MKSLLSNALLTELDTIHTDYKNRVINLDTYKEKATESIITHSIVLQYPPILRQPLTSKQSFLIEKYIKADKIERVQILIASDDMFKILVKIYNLNCRKIHLEDEALQYALDSISCFVYKEKKKLGMPDASYPNSDSGATRPHFNINQGADILRKINELGIEWMQLCNYM